MGRIATRTTFSSRPVDGKFSQIVISPVLCKPSPKRPARFKVKFDSLSVGMLRRPRFELTPRLIRWEVMSSSHLTNGKIVEFAPNGPQTESSEPNEQFIAMLVYEPRNSEQYRSFSLSRNKKINRKLSSGYSQEIVILLEINKQDTSPSFRSVRFPKPQIIVEMFRRNLQSSVWKRHVSAHQMCTNMAAGK